MADVAALGLAALAISTVLRGYGNQDYAPEPDFLRAFIDSYGPVMTATVIELVRLPSRFN